MGRSFDGIIIIAESVAHQCPVAAVITFNFHPENIGCFIHIGHRSGDQNSMNISILTDKAKAVVAGFGKGNIIAKKVSGKNIHI
ncbi:hypothetical protein SDC9_78910 [bioreactor metagenome]|uniref:Uncharacterized protein n=1 Tax=bioreactor metagenome TaxID=1076179 RepID=A0A644YWF4_9ZZZZ